MFIYELLTLHQPFENHESVKECILEGGRPSLSRKVIRLSASFHMKDISLQLKKYVV